MANTFFFFSLSISCKYWQDHTISNKYAKHTHIQVWKPIAPDNTCPCWNIIVVVSSTLFGLYNIRQSCHYTKVLYSPLSWRLKARFSPNSLVWLAKLLRKINLYIIYLCCNIFRRKICFGLFSFSEKWNCTILMCLFGTTRHHWQEGEWS